MTKTFIDIACNTKRTIKNKEKTTQHMEIITWFDLRLMAIAGPYSQTVEMLTFEEIIFETQCMGNGSTFNHRLNHEQTCTLR